MPDRSRKRPRDPNELGAQIVREATNENSPILLSTEKDPAAVELGRRGGLKGGKARAAKLTKEERVAAARKAAEARWRKKDGQGETDSS
jgi:hypothetical protein